MSVSTSDHAALAESEERYRRILETAAEGVWVLDEDNTTSFVNRRMAELLGYAEHEMVGHDAFEFFADEREAEVTKRRLAEQRAGRRTEADHALLAKDGSRVAVCIAAIPLFDDDGTYTGSLKMVSDIRLRVEAERESEALRQQLIQSQKLEAIGRLAGGIAHDFNNLLAVILNYASFAAKGLDDRPEVQADVREIKRAAQHAASLTEQLLVFSRQDIGRVDVFDLSAVIADMEDLLRRTLGEHLELRVFTGPEGLKVAAGPGQIEQIVLNLAVNARDALGDGGVLTIRTECTELDDAAAARRGLSPGTYARLTVADDGSGMTPEVAARAIEPFFTTKAVGDGSGLGLAMVYGIVEQAGGHLSLETTPGQGTSVAIHLPAATEPVSPRAVPNVAPVPASGCAVLLVEDDDAIRALTGRMLRERGYLVAEAADALAALDLVEDRAEPFDVLLTDVVMPGMSGKELAVTLRARFPGMAIVIMSGYTKDLLTRDELAQDRWTFLAKPFTEETLFPALHTVALGR